MKRIDSIDVMRTFAIVCMVICHYLLFFSPYEEPFTFIYLIGNEVLGGLGAYVFLFLVGASQALSLSKKPPSQKILDPTGIRMIKRGVVIFIIGLLFQIPIEGAPYEWDALPFIGVSLIVLCFIRRSPLWFLLVCFAFSFFVAPWLRGIVGYLYYWEPILPPDIYADGFPSLFQDPLGEYLYGMDTRLSVMFTGFFITGYFPLFPWIMCPISGFMIGRMVFGEEKVSNLSLGILGVIFMATGTCLTLYAYQTGCPNYESGFFTPLSFFPPTPPWLVIQFGFCLFLFSLCRTLFDKTPREGVFINYCRLIGRYSLTIYLIHYLLAYWPPRLASILDGGDTHYISHMMNSLEALILAILTLVVFYFLFAKWDKGGGRYSLEWFLKTAVK